jgi:AraC-like DNA-binding protein/ActR/RegA family two-component response regulator
VLSPQAEHSRAKVPSDGRSLRPNDPDIGPVLLISDDPVLQETVAAILESDGFVVIVAASLKLGLAQSRTERPELILLDLATSGVRSCNFCAQVASQPATRDTPVVLICPNAGEADRQGALRLGALDSVAPGDDLLDFLARVRFHVEQNRQFRQLLGLLLDQDCGAPAELPGASIAWLHAVASEGMTAETSDPASASHCGSRYSFTMVVAEFLRQNLGLDRDLDELARVGGTNRTTLNLAFQQVFGLTVFDWLREQRLLRAAELLRTTRVAVHKIGAEVGYASHPAFTTAFQHRFGSSPREYRASKAA